MAEAVSDEERARRLADAEATLPEPLRVVREQAMAPVVAMQHEAALRASGASPADIQADRTAKFGPEAAQRLLESEFSPAERLRVAALERIAEHPLPAL